MLRAPSGLTVHLVSRPGSMVSHLAVRTSPRPLLSRPRAALDRLIASLLSDTLGASVSLDRRGLRIDRDVGQDRLMQAARELLSLGTDPRWSASGIASVGASLRVERQQTPALRQASVVRRFFGSNTWEWEIHAPDAAVPNPSPDEVRARLAELLVAEGSNLVIVGAASRDEMRSELETTLGTALAPVAIAEAPVSASAHEPQAPRPQLHAFASPAVHCFVTLTIVGPDTFDEEGSAFEVAMSLLTGSAALAGVGQGPARQSTRWILGRTMVTVEVPVTADGALRVVEVARAELARLGRAEDITARELEAARRSVMAAESARFERHADLASSVLDAASAGVPLTRYAARFEAIAGTTAEDVALSAERHFALERVAFTVLASEDTIARIPELPGGRSVIRQRQ